MKAKRNFDLSQQKLNEELRRQMAQGVVTFKYLKSDGSQRTAQGTLCPDLIPDGHKPRGGRYNGYEKGFEPYYDVERQGWRSYAPSWLLWIEKGGQA